MKLLAKQVADLKNELTSSLQEAHKQQVTEMIESQFQHLYDNASASKMNSFRDTFDTRLDGLEKIQQDMLA